MATRRRNTATPSTDAPAAGRKPDAYVNMYVKMMVNGKLKSVKLCAASLWEDDPTHSKFLSHTDDMDEAQQHEFFMNLLSKGSVQVVRVDRDEDVTQSEFVL